MRNGTRRSTARITNGGKCDEVKEMWKPVPGYEGRYLVSNLGAVVSATTGKPMSLSVNSRGYFKVTLHNGRKLRTFTVYRLVAICFVENPNQYREVNHIDENKLNNRADNLEWCTRKYNVSYGSRISKQQVKVSKPVIQYGKTNEPLAKFGSISQAARKFGLSVSSISACCKGKRKSCGGYRWQYE